eukprot:TRINITY_DN4181_c0_g1_i1.p1 TRINITY_DN4181_c0_g1~~TRINITY_DN4181_c0_g1_i1.p1  ORF type:complete len:364 (+),score=44.17 TRINITY_DN4181_c0_g1_i1:97-1092(+)
MVIGEKGQDFPGNASASALMNATNSIFPGNASASALMNATNSIFPGNASASALMNATNSTLTNGSSINNSLWRVGDELVGPGEWCQARVPHESWALRCVGGMRVKVLTYNLFWWNLFGLRGGDGRRSGRLISATGWPEPYDIMGFQECDDVTRIITDAGLHRQYAMLQGPHALGMAYRLAAWEELGRGEEHVAEDRHDQWYGQRAVMWVRLRQRATNLTLLFLNHHGPLPLSTGGKCGHEATAYNIMKVIGENADVNDNVVLVGDFNSVRDSSTVQKLSERMYRLFSGDSHGGVDHIFSSCGEIVGTWNLGTGGSDHDALSTILNPALGVS